MARITRLYIGCRQNMSVYLQEKDDLPVCDSVQSLRPVFLAVLKSQVHPGVGVGRQTNTFIFPFLLNFPNFPNSIGFCLSRDP